MENIEIPTSWKGAKSVDEAKRLIDYGVLLAWKDSRPLKKLLNEEELEDVARHFAKRMAERVESRLPEEILIESLLVFLVNTHSEKILNGFLEEVLLQPNFTEACMILTELAITADISDSEHSEDLFSMAVALICELGTAIFSLRKQYPKEFRGAGRIMDHISTYLLSVSNSSNPCIRLSLVHYFGVVEQGSVNKPGFNRIMGRFGHTVLEHLFVQLFQKKTEAVALQFLLENLPYVLEGDNHCQNILYETLKFYMLKKPDRFCLFIHTLAKYLRDDPDECWGMSRQVFLKHLGVLLKVISDLNHKVLGRELLIVIVSFDREPFRNELIQRIRDEETIRSTFIQILDKLMKSQSQGAVLEDVNLPFKTGKRGRKPSFSRNEDLNSMNQVSFLGQRQMARAS